jgi:hypothetical protein
MQKSNGYKTRQYHPISRNDIALFSLRRPRHGQLHGSEHVFNKDAVSRCRIIDQNVRHSTYKLSVLDNGRARHECGQVGTTVFYKIFIKLAHRLGGGALFLSVLINL